MEDNNSRQQVKTRRNKMGFFSELGKGIDATVKYVNKKNAEALEKYERFQNKSTEELIKIARGQGGFFSDTSFTARAAACKILKERGYDPNER